MSRPRGGQFFGARGEHLSGRLRQLGEVAWQAFVLSGWNRS
jgi:hypothetical protein